MSLISDSLAKKGLAKQTLEIIMASWRPSTHKQYSTYLNKWQVFCKSNGVDILLPTVEQVLQFLTELYQAECGYSALNTARSALATIILLPGNIQIGNHPLISRFLKGVFQTRPTLPRYTQIWNIDVVINYLRSLSPATMVTLKELTLKVTMLLMLLSGQRIQTIQMLSIDYMHITNSCVKFKVHDKVKQTRPGCHVQDLSFKAYAPDRRLCILTYLKRYLDLTESLRKEEKQLLISFSKPHKAVSKDTISRWLKSVLDTAGIDTSVFSAYSVRSASTSAAKAKGASMDQVLSAGGWSAASTFGKYYNKPIIKQTETDYATIVLKDS